MSKTTDKKQNKRSLYDYLVHYYTKDTEMDITLFKILGTAGILVSIASGMQSIVTGISLVGGLIDFLAAFASVLLMWFVDKTGKYVIGYIITSVGIFMILFSVLFFEMGGMEGSMTYFFAFGIVFVFLMYSGKLLVIMEILQVAVYTFVCVYSMLHPESVTQLATEQDQFLDRLVGILFSGAGIGLIFMAYIAQYRKQKRIADEANLAKSRFLANMSHEIRTPINMMMGMNEMILRESENDTVKSYAVNAEDAGRQLISVVNQILQYSKLEVGKDELVTAPYDFERMISGIQEYFGKEAEAKNLSFEANVDEDIENVLVGDMRKISQILTNLLSNAIKYTQEGSITLNARNLGHEGNAQKILFEVKDTGIGIKESELKKIFESFERSDLLHNQNIEGTGLGLAIAQSLANMMGSKVSVESVYGEGSTFSMELIQTVGRQEMVLQSTGGKETFVAPEARILAVDDNEMNLNVLKSLLKKTMMNIHTASGAEECYDKCAKTQYDLIFMDLMMPDIDGIEALKHLRTFNNYNNVPIVALTADVSNETEERLLSEGFDGYITKPVDWRSLEDCLMKKLPSDLVIRTNEAVGNEIDSAEIERMAVLLKPYDVELSEGLHYMGGDIVQYVKVVEYFITNSKASITELTECIKNNTFDKATYIFHSLKGNARNVGSIELHYLSKRLEKRCRDNDFEYVRVSEELFILEWNRVIEGLKKFLEAFKPIMEQLEKQAENENGKQDSGKELNFEDKMKALLEAIENCRQIPATSLISDILQSCDDTHTREQLNIAGDLISKIEFEEAAEIIRGLLQTMNGNAPTD